MTTKTTTFRPAFQPWTDPGAKPFIEFRNVTKRYGTVTAVDNLSLSIYEREFFALLGPSGCGKTTLMRMLAGFETATQGEVWLDGKNLADTPPHRRPVNMMFQSYALFPHMSVANNIAYGLRQDGMARAERHARVEEMLALVKLQDFGHRKPDQLSGGQRQRVALARALAKQPKLLLLDEPLGALDRKLREETQFELTDLQERLGITFMIVTHDQGEAMTVADRIAVMEKGRIVQIDPPVTMYERPSNTYVADFLGDINLVPTTVGQTKGGRVSLDGEDGGRYTVTDDETRKPGDVVWFATRPEKLEITRDKPANATNLMAGEVWDIAYMGDLTTYKIKLDAGPFVKASILNRQAVGETPLTWEDRVWLSCNPDDALVLSQ